MQPTLAAWAAPAALRVVAHLTARASGAETETELALCASAALVRLGFALVVVYEADERRSVLRPICRQGLAFDGPDESAGRGWHGGDAIGFDEPLLAARAARTWQLQVVPDVEGAPEEIRRLRAGRGPGRLKSCVAAPLVAGDRLHGVLVGVFHDGTDVRIDQLDAIRAIADVLALGLSAVEARDAQRRLEHELREEQARRSRLADEKRRRDEWAAVVTHEVRQPLQVVTLTAEALLKGAEALSPKMAAGIHRVLRSVEHTRRLITDLLDTTQIESQQLALICDELDPGRLARDVAERFAAVVAPGRAILVDVAPNVPVIRADSQRLEEVLTNLLSNAVKYGEPGTDIEVSLSVEQDAVRCSVLNHGPEIPPEQREAIFERFYRGPGSSQLASGLGLGLYIARGIIEAHGGRMWVDSDASGTMFSFALPIARPRPRLM